MPCSVAFQLQISVCVTIFTFNNVQNEWWAAFDTAKKGRYIINIASSNYIVSLGSSYSCSRKEYMNENEVVLAIDNHKNTLISCTIKTYLVVCNTFYFFPQHIQSQEFQDWTITLKTKTICCIGSLQITASCIRFPILYSFISATFRIT